MKSNRITTGLMRVVVLAFLGFLLIYIPPQLIAQYRVVREMGSTWATLYLVAVGTGAVLLGGSSLWIVGRLWWRTRKKDARRRQRAKSPLELSGDEKQREIEDNLAAVKELQGDQADDLALQQQLDSLVQQLKAKQQDQTLEIVAFGTVSSGKSSLLNALAGRDVFATDPRGGTTLQRNEIPWPGVDRVLLVDTPGLGEVAGQQHGAVAAEAAKDADLVLMVVDGPLRDTEHQLLKRLADMDKRVLLCLNKEDWYDRQEKQLLLGQLARQVEGLIQPEDVVAVRSRPAERPRVRVLSDGRQVEETVEVPPDISTLARRMMQVVQQDGRDLLLANLLLQSRGLVEESRERVQAALDRHAWKIVDRYMWGAGGAAALSPLPLLDLVAGSAISVKMVVELAKVYRQQVDLRIAVDLLGQLGKNLLGILGASAATPAVAAAAASLLKTVPGAGTLAGGVLQGLVQALITRWIGAVFIEYFKNEMRQPEGGLASLARRQWEQLTTAVELRKLLQSARQHMMGTSSSAGESRSNDRP